MAGTWAVLCLVSHHGAGPCAESRYNLGAPSMSCGQAMSALGPQPPPDHESLRWELTLEQGPRQDQHQRGKGEGEAELSGFSGGCTTQAPERPFGCRHCRAPPTSTGPVTLPAASSQQHAVALLGWHWALWLPSLCPGAARLGLPSLRKVQGEGREGWRAVSEGRREQRARAPRQNSAPHGPPSTSPPPVGVDEGIRLHHGN